MHDARAGADAAQPTILVAEDDPGTRAMLTELLSAYGFGVVSAADGETTLRLAQTHRPDVICLDLGLPGMGGLAAAAALQGDPRTRLLPIVAITGCAMDRQKAEAIARLCVAYVPKPFGPQRLLSLLACILGRRAGGDAATRTAR